jgi:hypothetical protein
MINTIKREKMKRYLPGLAIIAVLIIAFGGGFYAGRGNKADAAGRLIAYSNETSLIPMKTWISSLLEVWNRLKANMSQDNIKNRDLFYGSLKGMRSDRRPLYRLHGRQRKPKLPR